MRSATNQNKLKLNTIVNKVVVSCLRIINRDSNLFLEEKKDNLLFEDWLESYLEFSDAVGYCHLAVHVHLPDH